MNKKQYEEFMKIKRLTEPINLEEINKKVEEKIKKEEKKMEVKEKREKFPSIADEGLDERPLVCAIVSGAAYDYVLCGRIMDICMEKGDMVSRQYFNAVKYYTEAVNFFASEWFKELTYNNVDPQAIVELCEKARKSALPRVDKDSMGRNALGYYVKGIVDGQEVTVNIVQAAADKTADMLMTKLQ